MSAVVFYYRRSEFTTDSKFTIRSRFSTGGSFGFSERTHHQTSHDTSCENVGGWAPNGGCPIWTCLSFFFVSFLAFPILVCPFFFFPFCLSPFWSRGGTGVQRYGCIPRSAANNLGQIPRKLGALQIPCFEGFFCGTERFHCQSPSHFGIRLHFLRPHFPSPNHFSGSFPIFFGDFPDRSVFSGKSKRGLSKQGLSPKGATTVPL